MENQGLLIAVLVVACLILLFLVEIYRNVIKVMYHYSSDTPVPADIQIPSSYLVSSKSK